MVLKVAMVTPWQVRCGIYSYSRDLANALVHQGVEVYVVRMPRFGLKAPEFFTDLAERIPVDKIDVIHCQHEYGLFQGFESAFYTAAGQLSKPIVTTMHAVGNWDVDGLLASSSRKVIVHNKFCLGRLGFPNAVIIPHGTAIKEAASSEEAKKLWGIDPRIPVVGYLGFITPYKGLETLVEAMAQVKGAAVLVGGGWHKEGETPYIVRLKEGSMKILEHRVSWLGFVPDERMKDAYGAMDVFVYPSRWATESGALLTALGYGKAIVARDLAPFKEKAKEGALLTFKNTADLAEKVQHLLKDEEARAKLEEGAKRYCEKTSWEKVAEQHLDLYTQVLEK